MRLVDLNPKWNVEPNALVVGDRPQMLESEEETGIVGLSFDCPHCVGTKKAVRLGIFFRNPMGKTTVLAAPGARLFYRRGEDLFTLSIGGEIDASDAGHWRGFIRDGLVSSVD